MLPEEKAWKGGAGKEVYGNTVLSLQSTKVLSLQSTKVQSTKTAFLIFPYIYQ